MGSPSQLAISISFGTPFYTEMRFILPKYYIPGISRSKCSIPGPLFLLSILLPRLVIYETILIVPLILYLVENLEKFYTKKNANIIFLFFFGFFLLNGDSSLIFLFLILTFLIIFLPAWRNW